MSQTTQTDTQGDDEPTGGGIRETVRGIVERVGEFRERWWIRWGMDLALIALLVWGVSMFQSRHLRPTGHEVPSRKLTTLEGETAQIATSGKTTLVYFWAPWCGVCSMASGTVARAQGWMGDDVVVKNVALSYRDRASVRKHAEDNELGGPVLLGDRQVMEAYNISSFPTFYVIDAEGRVSATSVGYTTTFGLLWRTW